MKRPFFLFFMGLVLGEAAAISLNRTGFFVMALFLFILILICFGLYQRIKRKRSPLFIYAIIFYGLFLAGGLLLLEQNTRIRQIRYLRKERLMVH